MKQKLLKGFCPHCKNMYYAKKLISVFGIEIPEGHNCKESKEYLKAQQKRFRIKY
jgi:hypothetical protein